MNKAALQRTRDAIAASPEDYDQSKWAHGCGTPACVAGFACVAHGGTIFFDADGDAWVRMPGRVPRLVTTVASEILELTRWQREDMFQGTPGGDHVTALDAIDMLDEAIIHDAVYW